MTDNSQMLFKSGWTNSTDILTIHVANRQKCPISQCRICLQECSVFDQEHLITPCKCLGSVNYVHFNCLASWIEKSSSVTLKDVRKNGTYLCQMCKYKIKFECGKFLVCLDKVARNELIQKRKTVFILYLITIISSVFLLSVGTSLIAFFNIFSLQKQFYKSSIIIIVFSIISIVLIIFIFKLIVQFVIIQIFKITRIKECLEKDRPKNMTTQNEFWLDILPQIKNQMPRRFRSSSVCPQTVFVQNIE